MKKVIFLTCFLLISSIMSLAQSPIWVLGNQYLNVQQAESLPTGPNPSDPFLHYQGQPAQYASNAYHNPVTGELLFFVVDHKIYDQDGYLIDWIMGSGASFCNGRSEIAIVADPGNCSSYYIFTVCDAAGPIQVDDEYPVYAKLDFSLDNIYTPTRKGALVYPQNGGPSSTVYAINPYLCVHTEFLPNSKFAISPKRSDNTHLVLVSDSYSVQTFILDASGLSPVQDNISYGFSDFIPPNVPVPPINTNLQVRGELEMILLSNGNYRLAIPIVWRQSSLTAPYSFTEYIAIFSCDLDAQGQGIMGTSHVLPIIDHPQLAGVTYIHGLEFSPDGNTLYVTHKSTINYPNPIQYLNFNNLPLGLQNLNINIAEAMDFENSHIEMNSAGLLLLATIDRLAAIGNPNTPNAIVWINNYLPINYAPNNQNETLTAAYSSFTLPDQKDMDPNCQVNCYNFTCGTSSAEESCCLLYSGLSNLNVASFPVDIVVSSTTTWAPGSIVDGVTIPTNGSMKVSGNIVIEPGATLTMQNLHIEFSPTSKVIVSRGSTNTQMGARLNVLSSTLTAWNDCGDCYMWRGIEAQGYNSISQSSSAQAQVLIQNNSKIEYAHFGVMAGFITNNNWLPLPYNTHSGALIRAHGSLFLNNRYDVFFSIYPNHHNSSSFSSCRFVTDENLRSEIVSEPIHVNIWNNRGIQFRACKFENTTPIVEGEMNRGLGILAANSNFIVTGSGHQHLSQFNKLRFGVLTSGNNSGLNYGIYYTQFNSNFFGIRSTAEQNSIIQNCHFNVFNTAVFQSPLNETYGINLIHCNRYQVSNNSFTCTSPADKSVHTFGCIIDNSGPFPNVIEQNEFVGLHTGGVSRRQNAANFGQKPGGLQWLCNDFTDDRVFDLWVQAGGNIRPIQGNFSISQNLINIGTAGNDFNTISYPDMHFFMDQDVPPVLYINHNGTLNLSASNNVTVFTSPQPFVCGRLIGRELTGSFEELSDIRLELYNDKITLEQMIDFGNTDSLMLEVLGAYLTAEQKRNLMMQQSITISDDVLIKYMETDPIHQHLYQVLIYNSPLTDKVIHHMMEESYLPSGMKQQVLLIQSGISEYEAKQQVLQDYELSIRYLESKYYDAMESDSSWVHPFEQIISMYEESPQMTLEIMENLFNLYLITHNQQKADSLNGILKVIVNNPNYTFMNDLAVSSLDSEFYSVLQDSSVIATLEQIADLHDYRDAGRAQAFLTGYLGYEFESVPFMGPKHMIYPKYTYDGSVLQTVSIFPNPAQDHFFIVFDENADVSQTREVKVYNLSGVLQFTREMKANDYVLEIKNENMAKGMYLVTISANGKEISTQKVAVR